MQTLAKRRSLIGLQATMVVSWLGDAMSNLAVPWFVLQVTGSATLTALAAVVRAVGSYGASVLAGPFIDRYSGKRIAIAFDIAAGLATLAIPLTYVLGDLALWQFYLLAFLMAVLPRPAALSRNRSLPEAAEHSGVQLDRATGLREIGYQSTLLAGPPLAGVLMVVIGPPLVLALDALSFLLSALIMAVAVPGAIMDNRSPQGEGERWSYRDKIREGISFVRRDALLFPLVASDALGILLVNAPLLSVMLLVYVEEVTGSAAIVGTLVATFAVGALAGASLSTALGHRLPKRRVWIGCFIAAFAPYVAIGFDLPIAVLYATMVIFGLSQGLETPLVASTRYRRVPKEIRGRVFGALTPITGLAGPLGVAIPALLFPYLGVSSVALVLLVPGVALVTWLVLSPAFHLMDASAETESGQTTSQTT